MCGTYRVGVNPITFYHYGARRVYYGVCTVLRMQDSTSWTEIVT